MLRSEKTAPDPRLPKTDTALNSEQKVGKEKRSLPVKKYRFHAFSPLPAGPEIVHLDLANACNLDCISCWNHSPLLKNPKSAQWKREKIDSDMAIRLIHEFAAMGTKRLIFSGGGEIFLHPDIYTLIFKATAYRKMKLTLITNLMAAKDLDFLIHRQVDSLLVNFHASNKESYRQFHPSSTEAHFNELIEKIHYLRRGGLRVKLACVINKINYLEIEDMIHIASDLDTEIQFKLAAPAEGTEETMLSRSQKLKILEKMPKFKKLAKRNGIKRTNLDVLENQLQGRKGHQFPIEQIGCYAGYFYTRIQIDGAVHYCCKALPIENVRNKSFVEIWHGEKYQKMRKALQKGKFYPVCKACGKYDLNFRIYQEIQKEI